MLRISRIKIMNFRSIENVDLTIDDRNIIAGENNTGKSNLMAAIALVFSRTKSIDVTDFYFSNTEEDVIINVMLQEFTDNKAISFNESWFGIFGESVVPYKGIDSITLRVHAFLDKDLDQFVVDRTIVSDYDDNINHEGKNVPRDFYTCYGFAYVTSDRDLSMDIKQKNSSFSKMINSIKTNISPSDKQDINQKLEEINTLIMTSFPRLQEIEKKLEEVGTILEKDNNISISPVPKNIDELKESIQILLEYNNSTSLPLMNYGDGTKSWLFVLSLIKSFELQKENNSKNHLPFSFSLMIEEPESHLHSNAQRKIWNQISEVDGQVVITTHSGDIICESGLDNLIVSSIENSMSSFTKPNFSVFKQIDKMKIMNQVIETKSSIIFANKILLVEGITETILFRGLFETLFGKKPHQCGLSIVRVDGKNNFPLFIDFLKKINKSFIVFADSDAKEKLSEHFREKKIDRDKLFFTSQKDIEKTLFEVFKTEMIELFWRKSNWRHIHNLCMKKTLMTKILKYLEDNKTNYPYELIKILQEDNKANLKKIIEKDIDLNNLLSKIGEEVDIPWN
jgi:putative ATP-dependent endonuclease of the OLD family